MKTTKVCPHCATSNRIGAVHCRQCGYAFASGHIQRHPLRRFFPKGTWIVIGALIAIPLVAGAILGANRMVTRNPTDATVVSAPAQESDSLDRALAATVQIITPQDNSWSTSVGSGAVISDKGYILTNFHVIGIPDTGKLYNNAGKIWVSVSPGGSMDPPILTYRAELVEAETDTDLALLRIVARADGNTLPDDLGLLALPVGDSNLVRIGDQLRIIGYPNLGGETVTLTTGIVSGFLEDEWIKTDAEINPGNSGGVAIDKIGELVGIPTAKSVGDEASPGRLGLVRPINMAQSLIDLVEEDNSH